MMQKENLTQLEQKLLDVVNPVLTNWTFILDEHDQPVPCKNMLVWGRFMEEHDRRKVEKTTVQDNPEIMISTVFLGMDHGYHYTNNPDYKPVLWETMVFWDRPDDFMERYTSLEDAKKGRAHIVGLVKEILEKEKKC